MTDNGTSLLSAAIFIMTAVVVPLLGGPALAGDSINDTAVSKNTVVSNTTVVSKTEVASVGSDATTSAESDSPTKTAISETAKNYENAFRKGDASGLAQMWAENGTYEDSDGRTYNGRAEIERLFQNFFKRPENSRNIEIVIGSVKPLGSTGAIERGVAQVKDSNGKLLSAAPYTVIHVNNGGKWEMASVSEAPARYFDNVLDKLRWFNGEWSAKGSEGEATLSNRWMSERHFLVSTFRSKTKSGESRDDMQVIGVDPRTRRIVSWVFDSDGGYGSGVWSTDGKAWAVDLVRTSADGRRMTSRNIMKPQSSDAFIWTTKGRTIDGLQIPDSDSITVNRIHL